LLTPLVLFVYNRPWHTRQTVEALQKNELASESDLFIFSDGIKRAEHAEAVREVRDYIHSIDGFKSVTITERDKNFGLSRSIIAGVNEIINRFGKAIVLEDDLVTSPYFLRYMNDALTLYQDESQVASIHGYVYPIKDVVPETFFIKGADCWGWGTWKRAWDIFEADGNKLLQEIYDKQLAKEFDFGGTYPYTKMLQDQIAGNNDSWAIRWYASAFLRHMLTLYPAKSLVKNIGLDSSGTHCGESTQFSGEMSSLPLGVAKITISENISAREAFSMYFKSQKSFLRRLAHKVMLLMKVDAL